jgi:hypothetical protein
MFKVPHGNAQFCQLMKSVDETMQLRFPPTFCSPLVKIDE